MPDDRDNFVDKRTPPAGTPVVPGPRVFVLSKMDVSDGAVAFELADATTERRHKLQIEPLSDDIPLQFQRCSDGLDEIRTELSHLARAQNIFRDRFHSVTEEINRWNSDIYFLDGDVKALVERVKKLEIAAKDFIPFDDYRRGTDSALNRLGQEMGEMRRQLALVVGVDNIDGELDRLDERVSTEAAKLGSALAVVAGAIRSEVDERANKTAKRIWGTTDVPATETTIVDEAKASRRMASRWTKAAAGSIVGAVMLAIKLASDHGDELARLRALEESRRQRMPYIDGEIQALWTEIAHLSGHPTPTPASSNP